MPKVTSFFSDTVFTFYSRMNTASCTTGWVNDVNESSQAALERSSRDAYVVITHSKAAVWTEDDIHTPRLTALFRDYPGEPVPER